MIEETRGKRERDQEQRKKEESLNWRTNSGCARCSLRGARPATSCHVMAVMRLRGRGSGRWCGNTDDDFGCGSLSGRRLSLAARSSVPSEGFGFIWAMGCRRKRRRNGGFEDLNWLLNSGFLPFPLFLISLQSLCLVSSISLSLPSPFLPDEGQRSDRKFASL